MNAKDRWGGTPMRDAVRHNHEAVALLLLGRGGEMGFSEVEASGELCELAKSGGPTTHLLAKCGCSVNAADYDLRTALHLAASEGNLPCVELLIGNADTNAKDRCGTPLADAVRQGHGAAAQLIQSKGGGLPERARVGGD